MSITGSSSVLQRKMEAGRDAPTSNGRSAAAALRIALARAADDLFDLAISVIGLNQGRVALDELGIHLQDDRLLVLLDGPDGQLGIATFDRSFLVALIQQQTMGRLTGTQPDDRPFTSTDASLTAPLIDAMVERAAVLADKPLDVKCLSGFRFGARAEDARSVKLAIDADQFRVFNLTVEFDIGPQQGALCLLLPEPAEMFTPSADGGAANKGPNMAEAAELARADFSAVICTMKVALADLSAMKPGDVLPLKQDNLDRTDLVSISGQRVAAGRLGQIGGMRALRLNETKLQMTPLSDQGGFAADIGAQPTARNDPAILDGELGQVSARDDILDHVPTETIRPVNEEDTDDGFSGMTPEEAAQEISALAGLSLDEENLKDDAALPMTID